MAAEEGTSTYVFQLTGIVLGGSCVLCLVPKEYSLGVCRLRGYDGPQRTHEQIPANLNTRAVFNSVVCLGAGSLSGQ